MAFWSRVAKGTLAGIARTAQIGGPMEELASAGVSLEAGIEGDARGNRRRRQVSLLFQSDWEGACKDIPALVGTILDWKLRRANLYIAGIDNPRKLGGRFTIGEVVLEVVTETDTCSLMERAQPGLMAALTKRGRGGLCCRVVTSGTIRTGDAVSYH